MASGRLQRAQAKAQRRKKLLADRRKGGAVGSRSGLAAEIRRAAAGPIETCAMQAHLFERGNGMIILTRRTGPYRLAWANFMVDTFCLGVKDAFFRHTDDEEIRLTMEEIEPLSPLEPVEPAYARKLLREAVAYAQSLGFKPHADYAAAEALFGDVSAESCDVVFEFGSDGRPLYIAGPYDSPSLIRRRTEQLRRAVGDDGFDVVSPEELFDPLDVEEESEEDGYDAEIEPDPEAWLALDEHERLIEVEAFHRRLDVDLQSERAHAALHTVIETQIAMGDELPVRRAIERLKGEGLTRHEAVHAVASVFTGLAHDLVHDKHAAEEHQEIYNKAVEQLTAEIWRREYGPEEEA